MTPQEIDRIECAIRHIESSRKNNHSFLQCQEDPGQPEISGGTLMTISLIAIASVMALCWAFGIVTDKLFTHWLKDRIEANTDADHDRWERDPLPTQTCDNCKWRNVSWHDEPCQSCASDDYGSRWEEEENDSHNS